MIGAGIGGTMAPFQEIAGSAFALISAYKFVFAQIIADIVMRFYDRTPLSLGITLILCNLLALSTLLLFRNRVGAEDDKEKLSAVV